MNNTYSGIFTEEQVSLMRVDIRNALFAEGLPEDEDALNAFNLAGMLLEVAYGKYNTPYLCQCLAKTTYHDYYELLNSRWLAKVIGRVVRPKHLLVEYFMDIGVPVRYITVLSSTYIPYRNAWVNLLVDEILTFGCGVAKCE